MDRKTLLGTSLIKNREPAKLITLNHSVGSTYLSRCSVNAKEEEAARNKEGFNCPKVPGYVGGNAMLKHLNGDHVAEAPSANKRPEVRMDQSLR